jgi:hypothetical protein
MSHAHSVRCAWNAVVVVRISDEQSILQRLNHALKTGVRGLELCLFSQVGRFDVLIRLVASLQMRLKFGYAVLKDILLRVIANAILSLVA